MLLIMGDLMKKFLSLVISVSILLCLCACGNTDTVSQAEELIYEEVIIYDDTSSITSEEQVSSETTSESNESSNDVQEVISDNTYLNGDDGVYSLNDEQTLKNIKFNGRCDKTDKGVNLNLAASAIEFNTDSTSIMMVVDSAPDIYYTIVVDGKVTKKREVTASGTNYINVARGLSQGEHNVKIIRDCEGRGNKYFTIVSLQLDDGALLTKDADKKVIEFLGDSLTSGYGNLVLNGASEPQEFKNQSSMAAYPYLIAQKFGLDYRIVSQSGIALQKREGYLSFPDYYNLENYHIDQEKKYASSSPADVDIVVVNLGTNDIGSGLYDVNNLEQVKAYEKHYANLITNIGYRKDVKIIFLTGVWNNDPAIIDGGVVRELNSLGYNNVYTLKLKAYKSGGGSHPSADEHKEIAEKLEKFFKENGIA